MTEGRKHGWRRQKQVSVLHKRGATRKSRVEVEAAEEEEGEEAEMVPDSEDEDSSSADPGKSSSCLTPWTPTVPAPSMAKS
jgi:hypothetical protein